MELVVVGSSGSVSGPGNPASCHLVRAHGREVVLDLGPGAFGALYGTTDVTGLDALVLSHLHADHCLDAVAMHVAARHALRDRWRRLPLLAPAGVLERLALADLAEPATGELIADEVVKYGGTFDPQLLATATQVGPFQLRTARVDHPVEAYAVRLEVDGASLVYSGDTGPCEALVELARGADVLLAEAGFGVQEDVPTGVHLTGRWAGEAAAAAGVETLVLTHLPPWADAAATLGAAEAAFDGDVLLARPGLEIPVGDHEPRG